MKITGIYSPFRREIIEIPFEKKADAEMDEYVVYREVDGKEELGEIKYVDRNPAVEEKILKESAILRKATKHDLQKVETNARRNEDAYSACQKKIREYNLDMQLFEAFYSLDGSKINFIYTAEERVDFRELVKDLAKTFQKQIHLKQIGPRDKARLVGGFGKCGRRLCY